MASLVLYFPNLFLHFRSSNSDDEILLAELARAYRKQLNRSTHRYSKPARRKPVRPGSDEDSLSSVGSDTAHESDADWDLDDSETEKESEGGGTYRDAIAFNSEGKFSVLMSEDM